MTESHLALKENMSADAGKVGNSYDKIGRSKIGD